MVRTGPVARDRSSAWRRSVWTVATVARSTTYRLRRESHKDWRGFQRTNATNIHEEGRLHMKAAFDAVRYKAEMLFKRLRRLVHLMEVRPYDQAKAR